MRTTKKLAWVACVSIFWAFPPLWGTVTSIIFYLLNILTNQGLIPAAVISAVLLQWKQRQNLHPVYCVRSPHTLSLLLSLYFYCLLLLPFYWRSIPNYKTSFFNLKKQTWMLSKISHLKLPGTPFYTVDTCIYWSATQYFFFSTGIFGCIH